MPSIHFESRIAKSGFLFRFPEKMAAQDSGGHQVCLTGADVAITNPGGVGIARRINLS
jgi:hypothetical protein